MVVRLKLTRKDTKLNGYLKPPLELFVLLCVLRSVIAKNVGILTVDALDTL